MSNIINLLIEELREHQKKRPDVPNDRFPMWYHDQYEQWQREDQAIRLLLGARLVQRFLADKEQDA